MRSGNIVRMTIILMIVGIVSAIALNLTHNVTSPIIEEQKIIAIEKTMFEFFPDANEVDFAEIDGEIIQYALANGEKIGVAVMVSEPGYGGDINIIVAVDMQGFLKGINIISHNESPGIGDIIDDKDFRTQFSDIASYVGISKKVDSVSGATASVNAVIAGTERGRGIVFEYLEPQECTEPVGLSVVPDGKHRGKGEGFASTFVVDVTVVGGIIKRIEAINSSVIAEYSEEVWSLMIERIIKEQSLEVDVVSGATYSSKGIKDAVQDAFNSSVD